MNDLNDLNGVNGVNHLVVTVNGGPMTVRAGSTIADLVADLGAGREPKGIAVAVDRCVIPRSEWSTTAAPPGVPIEIVTAVAGG